MPRTSSITYEDFCAAAGEIHAAGGRVSIAALKARLGGGYEVLRRYLDAYEQEQARRSAAAAAPAGLVDGMRALYDQARVEALASVRAEQAGEQEAIERTRQALDEERRRMAIQVAAAEALATERQQWLMVAQHSNEDLSRAVVRAQDAATAAEVRAEGLAAEMKRLQADHAAAEQSWREESQRVATEHQQALQKANASAADAMRQALLLRDDVRTMHKQWADDLGEGLKREVLGVRQALIQTRREQEEEAAAQRDRLLALGKQTTAAVAGLADLVERVMREMGDLRSLQVGLQEQIKLAMQESDDAD